METDIDQQQQTIEELMSVLSVREKQWADHFISCLNKREAALRSGYAETSATVEGWRMYNKAHVRAYVDAVLKNYIGEPDENIKLLRAMADTDINDYMTAVSVSKSDTIEVNLLYVITDLEKKLKIEKAYCMDYIDDSTARGKIELTESLQQQAYLKRQIGRLKTELSHDKKATRIITGPAYMSKEMVLDLNKIHADKERGKIKKFKQNKDGSIEVEFYDAKDAAIQLLKIAGKYEDKGKTPVNFNFDGANVVFK